MSAKELPAVRLVTIDGRKEVYVPLVGKHGTGREMLLDGDVWRRIKAHGGMRCRVTMRRDGRLYADHPDLRPHARWILDAPSGEQVRYGNGDWFDLRRCNLNMAKESALGRHQQEAREQAERRAQREQEEEARRSAKEAEREAAEEAMRFPRLVAGVAALRAGIARRADSSSSGGSPTGSCGVQRGAGGDLEGGG
jgi:hypothetical protein